MIRRLKENDLSAIMQIWLNTNISSHNFISKKYWLENYEMVKAMLPQAEIYVHEDDNTKQINGFIGLSDNYMEGLFIKSDAQSQGFGKQLLEYVKNIKTDMKLSVYQKNVRAIRFYKREGFSIVSEKIDDNTKEKEFLMGWSSLNEVQFKKFTDYNRGIMYEILKDAYSFDERCAVCWDENWKQSDAFFFDNPDIADKYGFVTCYKGEPIGFICWDPRNRPEYVEIGHNGIRTKYKGKGFGKAQLSEAVRRIKEYEGLKEIRVLTNSNLIAPKNYESAGFVLYDTKENKDEAAFSGDYLYYKIQLK